MSRTNATNRFLVIGLLILLGGIATTTVAMQTVNVREITLEVESLTDEEEAYYEYVAPRLDILVIEVDATREMVETKSRDIVSLTRAGNVIETLTGEIETYGEEHGVPFKFATVHAQILQASGQVNLTFDEARSALRSFNFSGMTELVGGFGEAADQFTASKNEMQALVPDGYEFQGQ